MSNMFALLDSDNEDEAPVAKAPKPVKKEAAPAKAAPAAAPAAAPKKSTLMSLYLYAIPP